MCAKYKLNLGEHLILHINKPAKASDINAANIHTSKATCSDLDDSKHLIITTDNSDFNAMDNLVNDPSIKNNTINNEIFLINASLPKPMLTIANKL
jgi:hypothetical protein